MEKVSSIFCWDIEIRFFFQIFWSVLIPSNNTEVWLKNGIFKAFQLQGGYEEI